MEFSYSLRYIYLHMVWKTVKCLQSSLPLLLCVPVLFGCTVDSPEAGRLVVDTYPPIDGLDETDTTLELYSGDMTLLAADDDGGDGLSARIDLSPQPEPGTYYIKVYSSTSNIGPYVIRALDLDQGQALPSYDYPGVIDDDTDNEDDSLLSGGVPVYPVDIDLGPTNRLNRYLGLGDDVDWLRLELQ